MDAYVISSQLKYARARAKSKLRLVRASDPHAAANRLYVRRLSSRALPHHSLPTARGRESVVPLAWRAKRNGPAASRRVGMSPVISSRAHPNALGISGFQL